MENDLSQLDQLQSAYKTAVEAWVTAIRHEESLASINHSVAEVDQWEEAYFQQDGLRGKVKAAKQAYEDALRAEFFNF